MKDQFITCVLIFLLIATYTYLVSNVVDFIVRNFL